MEIRGYLIQRIGYAVMEELQSYQETGRDPGISDSWELLLLFC